MDFEQLIGLLAKDPDKARAALQADRGLLNTSEAETGNTAFHHFAAQNAPAVVDLLLQCGADVNVKNAMGQMPLHSAARFDRGEMVAKLLKAGANVHAADESGDAAIHAAVEFGCMKAAAVLIEAGANTWDTNGMGQTMDELVPRTKKADLSKLIRAAKKK